jgi:hypothetical protein
LAYVNVRLNIVDVLDKGALARGRASGGVNQLDLL